MLLQPAVIIVNSRSGIACDHGHGQRSKVTVWRSRCGWGRRPWHTPVDKLGLPACGKTTWGAMSSKHPAARVNTTHGWHAGHLLIGGGEIGGVWHKASVSICLPLAAPISLSPLLILTLCGPERVLVVSPEPPDDLSCLTTPGVGRPGDGAVARAVDQGHPDAPSESMRGFADSSTDLCALGCGTQKFAYQKSARSDFPNCKFVCSHDGHVGLGRGGASFGRAPPPLSFQYSKEAPVGCIRRSRQLGTSLGLFNGRETDALVLHCVVTHFWQISRAAGTRWPKRLAYNNGRPPLYLLRNVMGVVAAHTPGQGRGGVEHRETSSSRPTLKQVPRRVPKPVEQSLRHFAVRISWGAHSRKVPQRVVTLEEHDVCSWEGGGRAAMCPGGCHTERTPQQRPGPLMTRTYIRWSRGA